MNIIIFGPPGAGKGTQSDFIVKRYNLFHLSTGNLLRSEIEKKSPLGEKISAIVNKGSLVSDDIVSTLIKNIVTNSEYKKRIIFDGYPRNLSQVKTLEKILSDNKQKIDLVLNTTSGEEHINEEAKLRLACLRQDVPCITSLFAMTKLIKAIASKADKEKIIVRSLQQIGSYND